MTLQFRNHFFRKQMATQRHDREQVALRERRNSGRGRARPADVPAVQFRLEVSRTTILEDTIQVIRTTPPEMLARTLNVVFRDEEAIDAGGVSREYFHLVIARIFSPDFGMFKILNNRYYWFNPMADDEAYFEILGTIVAVAVYNDFTLPIRFPLLLYKKLLEKEIVLSDLAELEEQVVSSLSGIRAMAARGESVGDLGLTFAVTIDSWGAPVTVPLIENGDEVDVTNGNLERYIREYLNWYANRSVAVQFSSFRIGFQKLFNSDYLRHFTADELDIMVSGEEVLDWNNLEPHAKYAGGYRNTTQQVRWFWEVFEELTAEQKSKFLQFTTGTDRAPMGGLSNVKITIQKMVKVDHLPTSHTCFSTLCLPPYASKMILKQKLLLALNETQGFGLR
jgi:ubiquitin-protein ligase E3 A